MEGAGLRIPRIEPVPVGAGYRLALAAVTLVVVLLPVLYAGLVAAGGLAWLWWALEEGLRVAGEARGQAAFFAYIGPLFIGAILLLFLVKPFFAAVPRPPRPLAVARRDHPRFLAFVDAVCAAVGAPAPREVCVDTDVNASASLRGLFPGFFGGQLRLTVGLPLLLGLTKRQLAGVLAHEFGHFTQKAALRSGAALRIVNAWLYRVAKERDAWDERLLRWSETDLAWLVWIARLLVWLTRRLLLGLMWASHALSCALMRQMEYDADRHEARLAGAATFAATSRRLRELGAACRGALFDLQQAWVERRLGDDFPGLVLANVPQIPAEVRRLVEEHAASARTGWFDTHPADAARLATVEREGAPGEYGDDEPAADLFADLPALCREATLLCYREFFGRDLTKAALVGTGALVAETETAQGDLEAIVRVGQRLLSLLTPVEVPAKAEAAEPVARLAALRDGFVAAAPAARERTAARADLLSRLDVLETARAFLAANLRAKPEAFGLTAWRRSIVEREVDDTARRLDALDAGYREAVRPFGERVRLVVALAGGTPAVAEAARLVDVLCALAALEPGVRALVRGKTALEALLNQCEANREHRPLFTEIAARLEALVATLSALYRATDTLPGALVHAEGDVPVGRYLVPRAPDPERGEEVVEAAAGAFERVARLEYRALGRLCRIVEEVEAAHGLPPLPAPPGDPPEKASGDAAPAG